MQWTMDSCRSAMGTCQVAAQSSSTNYHAKLIQIERSKNTNIDKHVCLGCHLLLAGGNGLRQGLFFNLQLQHHKGQTLVAQVTKRSSTLGHACNIIY